MNADHFSLSNAIQAVLHDKRRMPELSILRPISIRQRHDIVPSSLRKLLPYAEFTYSVCSFRSMAAFLKMLARNHTFRPQDRDGEYHQEGKHE